MILITIDKSTSRGFYSCLEIGAGLKGFDEIEINGVKSYQLKIPNRKRLKEAMPFIEACRRLRSKRVTVDGEEQDWKSVFKFVDCHSVKQSAGHNHKYCHGIFEGGSNLFGCQRLAGFEFGRYGRWNGFRWIFSKPSIKRALNERVGHFRHCPAFDEKRSHQIVDALPASANPVGSVEWVFDAPLFRPIKAKVHRIEIKYPKSVGVRHALGVAPVAQAVDLVDHLNLRLRRKIPFEAVEYLVINVDVENSVYDKRMG